MKIYIAGPMRGYTNFNFDNFDAAEERLYNQGHTPISPAAMDRLFEGWEDYPTEQDFAVGDLKRFIRRDIAVLLDMDPATDAIYMLNGWENSKGALVEVALANFIGLKVMYE